MVFSYDSTLANMTHAGKIMQASSPQVELADQTNDDFNNSLIFGNDQKSDPVKKSGIGAVNEDSALFQDEETQADFTRLRLDVSPDESPFLNKLKDPFEDTLSVANHTLEAVTPPEEIEGTLNGVYTFRRPQVVQNSGVQDHKETVNALNDTLKDTQKIPNNTPELPSDTQLLLKDTQVLLKDTQVLPNDTQSLSKDTQVLPKDTQVLPKDTQVLLNDTQRILQDTQVPKDTQILQPVTQVDNGDMEHMYENERTEAEIQTGGITIESTPILTKGSSETQVIGSGATGKPQPLKWQYDPTRDQDLNNTSNTKVDWPGHSKQDTTTIDDNESNNYTPGILRPRTSSNSMSDPTHYSDILEVSTLHEEGVFDPTRSMVQIPGTVERNNIKNFNSPKTQVMNTQEYFVEESMEVDLADRPVLSSSQNLTHFAGNPEESVDSEDERTYRQIQPLDDSVLKHEIRGREKERPSLDYEEKIEDISLDISPLKDKDKTVLPSMTLKRELSSDSDSRLTPQEADPAEEELELFLPKRRKPNVIESQSQSQDALSRSTPDILREETLPILPSSAVAYRTSVWAAFKFKMYPGVVVDAGTIQLEILFEEGTYTINSADLSLLDIRIGDSVMIKGSSLAYVVTGLSSQHSSNGIRCIRGFNTVHLKKRIKTRSNRNQEITAPLSQCFMELTDWYEHQQKFAVELLDDTEDTFTSIIRTNLQSPARRHAQDVKQHSINFSNEATTGIFSGSIFCITGVDNTEKDKLESLIKNNGGQLLDEGFMDLFEYKKIRSGLRLLIGKVKLDMFKFVALISNGHSRSSKYLQAVSLGWPILSTQFIYDCDTFGGTFQTWPVYMLPAGHSLKIDGVKSLDLYKFRQGFESGVNICDQIHLNGHLMNDFVILGLNNQINDKELTTCEFIFYCFGVGGFKLLDSSKKIIDTIKRDNYGSKKILIYDNSGFFKKNYLGSKKSRKLVQNADTKVGLIDWEWVVQCCISSFIWECPSLTV